MAGIEDLINYAQIAQIGGKVFAGIGDQKAANYNAKLIEAQARQAAEASSYDEAALRRQQRQEIASQVASIGSRGLDVSGSIVDVIRQNAANAEMDALALRYRGQIEQAGYKSQAQMKRYEGKQALYSGIAGAGSKLLTAKYEDLRKNRTLAL
jgi:hypothetical protein